MPIENSLERIETALHTAHYNARRSKEQDIYTEALQDITDIQEAVSEDVATVIKNGDLSPDDLGAVWGDWHKEIAYKGLQLLQSITAKHKGE